MPEQRALVVSYHAPQLDRDSGARRIFHLIELLLEEGWLVSFLASDGIGDERDAGVLRQRGVAVYDGVHVELEDVLREGRFDLALIAFWLNAERYLPTIRRHSPATRVIVDSVDLHFVRESRQAFTKAGVLGRGLSSGNAARMAGELNTYAAADGVLTVSAKEAALVNDLVCDPTLTTAVPDFEELPASDVPLAERRGIVCVGSFQHRPNVDAVRHLCREILPLVDPALLDEHPVWIVGNGLGDDVRAFGRGLPQVRMVGWVPSVEPYLNRARVNVVPLLYGAGTKRKLIQALAAGTPTVSTTIGVEGLGLLDRRSVLVADDPDSFAAGITELLTDSALWQRVASAGRRHVRETNSAAVAKECFLSAIASVRARHPKPVPAAVIGTSAKRLTATQYDRLVEAVQRSASEMLPADANVLVVSRGDERLLDLGGRQASHFPQDTERRWAGFHPESSAAAIAHLETLRGQGVDHLLFPEPSLWWLEHYAELAEHLADVATAAHRDESCVVFRLPPVVGARPVTTRAVPQRATVSREADGEPDGNARLIAFYLPQFHPIPENDEWWGEGFTEWRNVARARPLFPGHYQPHVPADLGFYDLRLAETRRQQAELAAAHGVHGFCYYHYWFDSTRLLQRPFDEVLASGEPDFPFCLCWANDPWSRRWNGLDDDLLQPQTYSPEDDVAHIRALLPALADGRAITVDGKPMFLIYRGSHLPDPARTCDTFRAEVERAGLPGIHLVAVETAWDLGWDATLVGFDAKVLFQPQFGWLMTHPAGRQARIDVPGMDQLQVYDYDRVRSALAELEPVPYRRYETVCPGWDNTARVGARAVVMHGSTPAAYERWLAETIERAMSAPPDHRLVFVNAWNEWAEGCHLEPDLRNGHAYLEATSRALHGGRGGAHPPLALMGNKE